MRIVQVGFNLQSVVDDKHNLILDYQITNKGDHRALAPMALKAKKALGLQDSDQLTVLADKGYHTGEQLQTCHDNNIATIVAIPRSVKRTDKAVQRNKVYVNNNRALYKRRQAIVEHPFGTIKRQWGFNHTLMKTIPKVQTEFSIILLCYNLRRALSILGPDELKLALKRAFYQLFGLSAFIKYLINNKYSGYSQFSLSFSQFIVNLNGGFFTDCRYTTFFRFDQSKLIPEIINFSSAN